MKMKDIHLRDPYILTDDGKYYMYGTRMNAERFKELGYGFDVYESDDLENWEESVAFAPPAGFWGDLDFWAPEVHKYKGKYYMFASFYRKDKSINRGTQILVSDSPKGPFVPHSDGAVTPSDWMCLDGTLYVDKNDKPYMVFCHEWVQIRDGEMCIMPLTDDLRAAAGEPKTIFKASEPSWSNGYKADWLLDAVSIPAENSTAKITETKCYVTDGPFLYRTKGGRLLMTWSSFSGGAYCVGLAYSDNGEIDGNWIHDDRMLFEADGGHGMIFETDGKLYFTYHQPNNAPLERPHFVEIEEKDDTLFVK